MNATSSPLTMTVYLTDRRKLAFTPSPGAAAENTEDLVARWRKTFAQKMQVFTDGHEMTCLQTQAVVRIDMTNLGNDAITQQGPAGDTVRVVQEITREEYNEIRSSSAATPTPEFGKEAWFLVLVKTTDGQEIHLQGWVKEVRTTMEQRKNLLAIFESANFIFRTIDKGLALLNPDHMVSVTFPCGAPAAPVNSYAMKLAPSDLP